MSAFEIYLIMQLDEIKFTLGILAFIVGMWSFFVVPSNDDEKRKIRKLSVTAVVLSLFVSFIPSTKTAAAMVVLPALTSEVVQVEAKEFYDLAKEALKQTIGADECDDSKGECKK